MAGLKAAAVPIQIVGASDFASVPADCRGSADTASDTPESLGANGILGIGVFEQDCGRAAPRPTGACLPSISPVRGRTARPPRSP